MTIHRHWCRGCGARVEAGDNGWCAEKACQFRARRKARYEVGARVTLTKEEALDRLQERARKRPLTIREDALVYHLKAHPHDVLTGEVLENARDLLVERYDPKSVEVAVDGKKLDPALAWKAPNPNAIYGKFAVGVDPAPALPDPGSYPQKAWDALIALSPGAAHLASTMAAARTLVGVDPAAPGSEMTHIFKRVHGKDELARRLADEAVADGKKVAWCTVSGMWHADPVRGCDETGDGSPEKPLKSFRHLSRQGTLVRAVKTDERRLIAAVVMDGFAMAEFCVAVERRNGVRIKESRYRVVPDIGGDTLALHWDADEVSRLVLETLTGAFSGKTWEAVQPGWAKAVQTAVRAALIKLSEKPFAAALKRGLKAAHEEAVRAACSVVVEDNMIKLAPRDGDRLVLERHPRHEREIRLLQRAGELHAHLVKLGLFQGPGLDVVSTSGYARAWLRENVFVQSLTPAEYELETAQGEALDAIGARHGVRRHESVFVDSFGVRQCVQCGETDEELRERLRRSLVKQEKEYREYLGEFRPR